jgi:hypothetical protein
MLSSFQLLWQAIVLHRSVVGNCRQNLIDVSYAGILGRSNLSEGFERASSKGAKGNTRKLTTAKKISCSGAHRMQNDRGPGGAGQKALPRREDESL